MNLIYAKGACSFSVHLLLEELGIDYEATCVQLDDKKVLNQFNSMGYVPVLELDSQERLTEAVVILEYLADEFEGESFYPAAGTMERVRCREWLVFTATELHQKIGPLFHRDNLDETYLKAVNEKVASRLTHMDEHLKSNTYLMGEDYSIADMYALAILRICEHVKIDLEQYEDITRLKDLLERKATVKRVSQIEAEATPVQIDKAA